MHNNKFLMKLVSYFLPAFSQILDVGEGYKVLAILEGDIDKDEDEEVIALYNRAQKNYLMVLKKFGRKWHVIWNNRIQYSSINKFELATLTHEYQQIVLGGKIEEEEGYKLTIFNWKQDNLHEMISEPIPFDKMYIQDVDGKDGLDEIVLWRHKELEAYDIDLYRYEENQLVLDSSLDPHYFKMIINYYQYLIENYEDEPIYRRYLEEAKRRYEGMSREAECLAMETPNLGEEETIYKAKALKGGYLEEGGTREAIEMKYDLAEMLLATTGYISNSRGEEDIYLWGKQHKEEGVFYFTELKLIVTSECKSKHQVIALGSGRVYDYQLFVGDFGENGIEQIWIGLDQGENQREWYISLYGCVGESMQQLFDSRQWEHPEGRIVEIYPVDKKLEEKFEICLIEELDNQEEWMTWIRWEEGGLKPYECYKIDRG